MTDGKGGNLVSKRILNLLFVLGLASTVLSAGENSPDKFEIRKFRFGRYKIQNYERLVLEFAQKEGTAKPSLKVVANPSGKEAAIHVDPISLVGAIPEAAINDSYYTRSRFLGPVSINTDDPGSLMIRMFFKQRVASPDVFWLESPHRLVIDVFPGHSPRRHGLNAVSRNWKREIAQVREAATNHPGMLGLTLGKSLEPVVCYGVSSPAFASLLVPAGDEKKQAEQTSQSTTPPPLVSQTLPTLPMAAPPYGGLIPPAGNFNSELPHLPNQPVIGSQQFRYPYQQQGPPATLSTLPGGGLMNLAGPIPSTTLGATLPPPYSIQRAPASNPLAPQGVAQPQPQALPFQAPPKNPAGVVPPK